MAYSHGRLFLLRSPWVSWAVLLCWATPGWSLLGLWQSVAGVGRPRLAWACPCGIQHSGREREQGTRLLEAQAVPSATVSWPEQITRLVRIQEEQTASISCREALQSGGRRPGWWQVKNWGQFCSLPALGPATGCLASPRGLRLLPGSSVACSLLATPALRAVSCLCRGCCAEWLEGGFQWPSSQGGRDAVNLARVKPSTDPIKLRQAAFSISQHRRAASPGAETTAPRSLLCLHLRPARLLGAVQGWGVALHCHLWASPGVTACWWGHSSSVLGGHGPLTSPQASARTSLWFACLWFPGKRVGRKGLPPQDSQAGWFTREVMLGSVGGRECSSECSLEEGVRGLEGRLSRKGLLASWRTGMGQKAHEKKPTHSEEAGKMWVYNRGGGLGDWDQHVHTSNRWLMRTSLIHRELSSVSGDWMGRKSKTEGVFWTHTHTHIYTHTCTLQSLDTLQ